MSESKNPFFTAAKNGERIIENPPTALPATVLKKPKKAKQPTAKSATYQTKVVNNGNHNKTTVNNKTTNNRYGKGSKPRIQIQPPAGAMTCEHKNQISYLVDRCVALGQQVNHSQHPTSHGGIRKNLNNKLGVSKVDYFLEIHYETAINYLQKNIKILKALGAKDENSRKEIIAKIHIRLKQVAEQDSDYSDEKRRLYLLENYGVNSLKSMQDYQLHDFSKYVSRKKPHFELHPLSEEDQYRDDMKLAEQAMPKAIKPESKPKPENKQTQREKILQGLVNTLAAQTPNFDPSNAAVNKEYILHQLQALAPELFTKGSFTNFMKNQHIIKLQSGRPASK